MKRKTFSRRRADREAASRRRLWLAAVGVVLFLTLAAAGMFLAREWNPYLTAELCPVDRSPVSETLLIVDGTDVWSPIERLAIERQLAELQARIPRFGRVHLFAVRPEAGPVPDPLVRLCNPGRPSDFATFPLVGPRGVEVVANPEELVDRWQTQYKETLDAIVLGEGTGGESSASPIMETLRVAALRSFGDADPGTPLEVVIISDLMQNSEEYSVYGDPEWEPADGDRLAATQALGTPALRDANVEILFMERLGGRGGPGLGASDLIGLWDSYISGQGGLVMRVRRVEG